MRRVPTKATKRISQSGHTRVVNVRISSRSTAIAHKTVLRKR